MKYSIVFKLKGALAEAVAVEWTDGAAPRGSGDGWEPCVRLKNGDWRIFSYGATDGRAAHWRDPGLFDNIGLRYRLAAAGPWSAVSESRKAITIVAVAPAALAAADWTPLHPADAGGASGAFALKGAAAGARAVEWSRAGAADWQPCLDLGAGRWRPAATAGLAGEPLVLRYAFAADGPWSPASADAKVLISGLPFLPLMLAAPVLAGTGRVGSEVTVDTGLWVGDPMPSLALQWRCDGADIAGAVGSSFLPGPAEDGRELACAVTARNPVGSITAVTAGLRVAYAPPVARGALLEEVFDAGSGPQPVDAAADFTGENLSWSVAGAGATIDAAGLVTIPTDAPLAELVTVTATNSGGTATSAFMVTVEVPDAEIPLTPTAADWTLGAVSLAAGTHTGVFTLSPALGAVEVQWLGVDVASYATEAALEPHYNPTVALGGNRWRHDSPPGRSLHLRANGTSLPHVRMRYRIAADGAWSDHSENRRTLDASLLPAEPPADGWHVMPFRTDLEASLGLKGGDQTQMWQGLSRWALDPTLILVGQDVAGTWLSDDDGVTWRKLVDEGLRGYGMQSVLIDPEDQERFYGVGQAMYTDNPNDDNPASGIYLTTDKGKHWTQVYSEPTAYFQRVCSEIVYDPNTSGSGRTLYATIARSGGSAVVVRSTDRGASWAVRSTIPASAAAPAVRGRVNAVFHHPSLSGVLFLCTQYGLFKSTNGGTSWTRMNGTGGLPVGEVVRVDINPANGNEIYCVVNIAAPDATSGTSPTLGLWRTTNGSAWTQIATPDGFRASKVFVGFADGGGWQAVGSRTLYLVGRQQQLRVSQNGGATWATADVSPQPGRDTAWDKEISDSSHNGPRPEITARIAPHPRIARRAFAHAKSHNFRTDDATSWRYSGEGFSGEVAFSSVTSIAFSNDPLRMAFGVTDAGYRMTDNGGYSFHVGRVSGYTEANESLKNSCHAIAIHPTNPNLTVASAGFRPEDKTRLFRSDVHFPGSYIGASGALRTAHPNSPWKRVRDVNRNSYFLQWNRDTPTVVYEDSVRSLDSGQTWTDYGAGFGGCRAVFPGNHDICYGLSGGGSSWALRRSNDRGATHSLLANIGWGGVLYGALFTPVLAIHPTDPASFFTISSSGDLARFDGNTGTWRTSYGMKARHVAAHPNGPSPRVSFVALDPQDANVGYVAMDSSGNHGIWRSQNIQAQSPDWEDITKNFHRSDTAPTIMVHPLTGDVLVGGRAGVGAVRLLPPPGARSHASLAGNWPVL